MSNSRRSQKRRVLVPLHSLTPRQTKHLSPNGCLRKRSSYDLMRSTTSLLDLLHNNPVKSLKWSAAGLLFRLCPVDVITAPRGFCSVWLLFPTLCFHPGCYLIAQCGSRCSRSRTTSEAAEVKVKLFICILSWRKNFDFTWTLLRYFLFLGSAAH